MKLLLLPELEQLLADEVYYAELTGKVGALNMTAGYYDFNDIDTVINYNGPMVKHTEKGLEDMSIWALSANYAFDKTSN